jgi:predicted nucleic acid-binding protein
LKQLVLDCSVAISWCLPDETDIYADAVLSLLTAPEHMVEAVVPSIWSLELANTLLVSERRGRVLPEQQQEILDLIEALPIWVDALTASQALGATFQMGKDYNLAAYDAAYLELAVRRSLPLATLDQRLTEAAIAYGVFLTAPKLENLPSL